jgi:hypothetical protein
VLLGLNLGQLHARLGRETDAGTVNSGSACRTKGNDQDRLAARACVREPRLQVVGLRPFDLLRMKDL